MCFTFFFDFLHESLVYLFSIFAQPFQDGKVEIPGSRPLTMEAKQTMPAKVASKSWPISAKLCIFFTVAQIGSSLMAHYLYEIGPRFKGINEDEIAVFSMARNALIIPMALITLVAMYQVAEMCSAKPRHRALVISRVPMFLGKP